MESQKLSISLSPEMVAFIEDYQQKTRCQSRSQVIAEALSLLKTQELEKAYQEASAELDEAWENTAGDGLGDKTW
ncbi:CopG family transcriptional regulator [Euhalothece natronophila Z-M001]|uniref:CopG family transcriptional regulator n=1 Tax=Euhalothece natronophila Z-M001 TaxID=522448 RepID=A0A5B8NP37_9CHRO|nr:type II toxin-antitoxin system ParD family antitoxin [Euhalothece natronophila]QDZ41022.1 CopG family transcriptional regulator [Euhalothece natronophila Z-M001]